MSYLTYDSKSNDTPGSPAPSDYMHSIVLKLEIGLKASHVMVQRASIKARYKLLMIQMDGIDKSRRFFRAAAVYLDRRGCNNIQ